MTIKEKQKELAELRELYCYFVDSQNNQSIEDIRWINKLTSKILRLEKELQILGPKSNHY